MSKLVTKEDRRQVYELCKTQLNGKWAEISEHQLIIKPVTDGFINKLFYCGLPFAKSSKYNHLVIRFANFKGFEAYYNPKHVLVINLLLSELRIAPKILSVFPNGFISEYIDCQYFTGADDANEQLVALLGAKLAKFHSLQVPIPKDSTEFHVSGILRKRRFTEREVRSYREGRVRQEIRRQRLQSFNGSDLLAEMSWLETTIMALKCPIVFSHNDFNRRNILIRCQTTGADNNSNRIDSEPDIYLIDFDWSNYMFRGTDFGQYFSSWAHQELDFGHGEFPSDQQMTLFVEAYIREMCNIYGNSYGKREINSCHRIIMEAKVFALFAYIKDIIFCIWVTANTDRTDLMPKADTRFQCFQNLKNRILDEYPKYFK